MIVEYRESITVVASPVREPRSAGYDAHNISLA
jgi:hypothetical protein